MAFEVELDWRFRSGALLASPMLIKTLKQKKKKKGKPTFWDLIRSNHSVMMSFFFGRVTITDKWSAQAYYW